MLIDEYKITTSIVPRRWRREAPMVTGKTISEGKTLLQENQEKDGT